MAVREGGTQLVLHPPAVRSIGDLQKQVMPQAIPDARLHVHEPERLALPLVLVLDLDVRTADRLDPQRREEAGRPRVPGLDVPCPPSAGNAVLRHVIAGRGELAVELEVAAA